MDGRPTEIMPQLTVLMLAIYNLFVGVYHANLTKRMEAETAAYGAPKTKIKHGWWAFLYVGLLALCTWGWDWWVAAAGVLIRKPFFDTSYNLARFNKLTYISNEVKIITGLWDAVRRGKTIDWIHWVIFKKNVILYQLLYLAGGIYVAIFKLQ